MKRLTAGLVVWLVLASSSSASERGLAEGGDPVVEVLTLAIERGVPLFNRGEKGACAALYEVAGRSVLALGPDHVGEKDRSLLVEALDRARETEDAGRRAWALRRAFDRILAEKEIEMSVVEAPTKPEFRFTREAPLPEGFPGPGPVGEVVLKEYPRYRLAKAGEGMGAFWTLFLHIRSKDIPMTAPVEMTLRDAEDGDLEQVDMAFLYESVRQGEKGRNGRVTVEDAAAITVLSYGMTGPASEERLAAARKSIEDRLGRDGEWEVAGPWRLLGYNSPMLPAKKRFFELQVPVRPAGGAADAR